jgi:DNA-binding response OmpR family regulator
MLKELRQRDDTHELLVVIVSAKHPISQEIRKLSQATVSKPFEIDKLLTVIRDIIPPPPQEQSIAKQ